jgi:hypothetical protein
MPGDSGVTVVTCLRAFYFCTQGCGRIGRPAFPAPSDFRKAERCWQNSRETRGEIAKLCGVGIHFGQFHRIDGEGCRIIA